MCTMFAEVEKLEMFMMDLHEGLIWSAAQWCFSAKKITLKFIERINKLCKCYKRPVDVDLLAKDKNVSSPESSTVFVCVREK